MSIVTGYRYGTPVELNAPYARKWVLEMLEESRAEFSVCAQCYGDSSVEILSAGGDNDPLDRSNSRMIVEYAESIPGAHIHYGHYGYVSMCIDVENLKGSDDRETLGLMIERREQFDDYPVFNEDDYSQLEWKDWEESMSDSLHIYQEEHHEKLREYVTEHYYGYGDPGYVNPDWVARAYFALKLGPRRIRVESTNKYGMARASIVVINNGYADWEQCAYSFNMLRAAYEMTM